MKLGKPNNLTSKNFCIALTMIILSVSACNSSKKVKVKGSLRDVHNTMVYLKEMTSNESIVRDSAVTDNEGNFSLTCEMDKPAFFTLYIAKDNYVTLILNPGEKVTLTTNSKNATNAYTVSGSADSELAKELNDTLNETLNKIDKLSQTYQDSLGSPNILMVRKNLDSLYQTIEQNHKNFTRSFIRTNQHSLAGLMALYQQLSPRKSVLDPSDDYELYHVVDSVLTLNIPQADAVQSLHNLMKDINAKRATDIEIAKRTAIGVQAPEIALPNPFGDTLKLSACKGKYVLLSFWASWNNTSRLENFNLIKIYWRYKYAGFEIYQFSLDKSKDSWTKAITDDRLTWMSVTDLKMWNSKIAALFGIQNIPANFLLNKEGKIVGKNLSATELSTKLSEIFKY